MSHLNREELARLVDEAPDALDARHLERCDACATELREMRALATSLRALPPLTPTTSAWTSLERRLEQEGLIRRPAAHARRGRAILRLAAALALLLSGGVLGALIQARADGGQPAPAAPAASVAMAATPGDAALALERAEANYLAALTRYAELSPEAEALQQPYARLAALEGIVLTTRAALDEAPADPVINGYHLTALAQREATLRHLASWEEDPWF